MIWGFTEFRTNRKNKNMTFLMKILQGLVLKLVYILLILNFLLNIDSDCYFSLVCDVNPSIPIYLFSLTSSKP